MKRALALLLSLGAVESLCAPAFAARKADNNPARLALLRRGPAAAVPEYSRIAGASPDGALAAEYGYVLAGAGFTELSLAELDRAFLLDPTHDDVLYYGSEVLGSLGLTDAAKELSRAEPAWLAGHELTLGTPARDRELGAFKDEFPAAQGLILQRRCVSAADRFARLTKKYPDQALAWSGLAIALDKLGATKTAAAAVNKDVELSRKDDPQDVLDILAAHRRELEEQPAVAPAPPPKSANEALKGRYLAFFGGSWMHSDYGSILNLNGRLGRFFTDRFDAGVNLGLTSGYDQSAYNGVNVGLSARYNQPLAVGAPLSATGGVRLQYVPAPSDRFSFFLSPGLSYFLTDGSVDVTLDYGVSGPLKNTATLSIGYTAYFGGGP